MKKRWALRFVLFVVGSVVATVLVLRTSWAAERICERGRSLAARILIEPVELGSCRIDPLEARVELGELRVGPRDAPRLRVKRVLLDFAPLRTFGGRVAIDALEIEGPEIAWSAAAQAAEEPRAPSPGCLALVDRIRLRRLSISEASLELALPEGRKVSLRELSLTGRRVESAYAFELETHGSYTDEARSIPLERLSAHVRLDTDEEHLALERFEAALGGVQLFAGGEIRSLCVPELSLRVGVAAELASLRPLVPALDDAAGRVELTTDLTGPVASPQATGSITARDLVFGELTPDELQARFTMSRERVELHELRWPIADGSAVLRGTAELSGDFPAKIEVRTEKLAFQRLLTHLTIQNTPVSMTIDSEHQLEGSLRDFEFKGTSRIRVNDFEVRNVPWHAASGRMIVEVPGEARIDTRIALDADGISVHGMRIGFGADTAIGVEARLFFTEEEGMRISASAAPIDIAHVNHHVAGIPLAGRGPIHAEIVGPYSSPDISGELQLEGVRLFAAELGTVKAKVHSFPPERTLDFLEVDALLGTVRYGGEARLSLGDTPSMDAVLRLQDGGRLSDLARAGRAIAPAFPWFEQNLQGEVRASEFRLRGPFVELVTEGTLRARKVRFLDRPFDDLSAELRLFAVDSLTVSDLVATRGSGRATASGEVQFSGETPTVDAAVEARALPIRDLLGTFGEFAALEGGVGGRVAVRGPVRRLDLSGQLTGSKLAARGVRLEPIRLSLETQGDEVVVRGPVSGAGTLAGTVRLAEGLPFDALLSLEVAELARYLPAEMGIAGQLRGTVAATGRLNDVTQAEGRIELERLRLALGEVRLESEKEVRASYAGSSFVVDSLRLSGENTSLALAGSRSKSGLLDLQAHGTFDARILDTMVPQIEHASGLAEINASLTGTAEQPRLVGSGELRKGGFRVRPLAIQVDGLDAKLAFSQNQVVIESATMHANQGRARVRGTIELRDFAPHTLALVAQIESASWRKPADWPAVVSGQVELTGGWPRALRLAGELTIDRLRYTKDTELEKAALDFRRRVREVTSSEGDEERIQLDLDLVGGRDMRVDNNLMRARLQFVAPPGARHGRLRLLGSNVRMAMLGSVEVLDGLAFFRGNQYRIRHGVVEFRDRNRIEPEFDLTATTEVREYRIEVHAFGSLDEAGQGYKLQLAAEPSLTQADIVTLLTFGITSRDLERGASGAAGAGVAAEALLTVSGLDEQLKRWLPDTQLLRAPDFDVTSQYSEITGQMEPMAVFEARVVSERLKLKAEAPLSTARGRRLSTEYTIDERLSTQLVWENEETGYSLGDLGLDLKLRWEWE